MEAVQYVHLLIYNDPTEEYIGTDVFDTYEAAFHNFRQRLMETKLDHADDPDFVEVFGCEYGSEELHFRDGDDYEVFYRKEELQHHEASIFGCEYCDKPDNGKAPFVHTCVLCGCRFCDSCFEERVGNALTDVFIAERPRCPECLLKSVVESCLADWMGEYAKLMPDTFMDLIMEDVKKTTTFDLGGSYTTDNIRSSIGRVIVRQFNVII